jgi:hypothetical protein
MVELAFEPAHIAKVTFIMGTRMMDSQAAAKP